MCFNLDSKEEIIKRMAYNFYQIRLRHNLPGDDKQDWLDAVKEYERYESLHGGSNGLG
jgi:hypothetical protein